MRVRILSRASDLARLQASLVGRAINAHDPATDVTYLTRSAAGDRDTDTPLAALPDKGAFTADLSDALVAGTADLVVHSWKDLPLEERADTVIAATLARADPRDVLLVRRDAVAERPRLFRVLSSSPRRAWLLGSTLPALLPWKVERIAWLPVRGNIATRVTRLLERRGDGLLVAKAALDRLLSGGPDFERTAAAMRAAIDRTRWMVLPIREVPCAPAQGALAVEVARANRALQQLLAAISHRPTWDAVTAERDILSAYGGGCHQAVGATVLPRGYGRIVSVRAKREDGGGMDERWSLEDAGPMPPRAEPGAIWPRAGERADGRAHRRALDVPQPNDDGGWWVTRADALPASWTGAQDPDRVIWVAGGKTWRKLAERGVWVNGSAEGLGDEDPAIHGIAGRRVEWHRLTHTGVDDPRALPTYEVSETPPDDLSRRTHFYWTSGVAFRRALEACPEIRACVHASGPGRTADALRAALGPAPYRRVWLDYDQWHREITT